MEDSFAVYNMEKSEDGGKASQGFNAEGASELLDRLALQDDELDDLVWEDEVDSEEVRPKWLALGRLLTT